MGGDSKTAFPFGDVLSSFIGPFLISSPGLLISNAHRLQFSLSICQDLSMSPETSPPIWMLLNLVASFRVYKQVSSCTQALEEV